MDWLGPRILKDDYDTGFAASYLLKDLGIALDECRKLNICLPGLALASNLYKSAIANYGTEISIQGLIHVVAMLNNKKFEVKK